jgi:hypothetical protein
MKTHVNDKNSSSKHTKQSDVSLVCSKYKHPRVDPLGMSPLHFSRPIELLKIMGNILMKLFIKTFGDYIKYVV